MRTSEIHEPKDLRDAGKESPAVGGDTDFEVSGTDIHWTSTYSAKDSSTSAAQRAVEATPAGVATGEGVIRIRPGILIVADTNRVQPDMFEPQLLGLHKRAPRPMDKLAKLFGKRKGKQAGSSSRDRSRNRNTDEMQDYDGPYIALTYSEEEVKAESTRLLAKYEANKEERYRQRCAFIRKNLQDWQARLDVLKGIPDIDRDLITWPANVHTAQRSSREEEDRTDRRGEMTVRLIEAVRQGSQIRLHHLPFLPGSIEAIEEGLYTAAIHKIQEYLRREDERRHEPDERLRPPRSEIVSADSPPRTQPSREQLHSLLYSAAEEALRALDGLKMLYRSLTIDHDMFEKKLAEEELAWQAEQQLSTGP